MTEPNPEYEAIRLATASVFDGAAAERLHALAEGGLDWGGVYAEAIYHGVQPVLYARLRAFAEAYPDEAALADLVSVLQRNVSARTAFSLFLTAEMAGLTRALDAAGVPFLALKGPSLAEAYGGVAYRPFVDNDVLIDRHDFDRVEAALVELGFERPPRTPLRLAGYLYIHGEFTFSRRVTGQVSTVDMHTALVPPGLSYHERLGVLLDRGRALSLGGATVRALSWEDLLIALCVNGFKDQWYRLRLVSDVAAAARMVTDWDAVFSRADASRSRRMVHTALALAEGEAGLDLPGPALARVRADARAVALSDRTRAYLRTTRRTGLLPWGGRVHLNLRSQDSLLGQVRYTAFAALRRATERFVDPEQAAIRKQRAARQ
jgi:hypothetical protein